MPWYGLALRTQRQARAAAASSWWPRQTAEHRRAAAASSRRDGPHARRIFGSLDAPRVAGAGAQHHEVVAVGDTGGLVVAAARSRAGPASAADAASIAVNVSSASTISTRRPASSGVGGLAGRVVRSQNGARPALRRDQRGPHPGSRPAPRRGPSGRRPPAGARSAPERGEHARGLGVRLGDLARRGSECAHQRGADRHPQPRRRGSMSAVRIRIGESSVCRPPASRPIRASAAAVVAAAARARAARSPGRRSRIGLPVTVGANIVSRSTSRTSSGTRPRSRYSVCARCAISLRYGPTTRPPGRRRGHHLQLLVDDHGQLVDLLAVGQEVQHPRRVGPPAGSGRCR